MESAQIAELVAKLSPEDQSAVMEFIEYLRSKHAPAKSPFLDAIDEFMNTHPELLRRLAQ
jgi:hypothetical protein